MLIGFDSINAATVFIGVGWQYWEHSPSGFSKKTLVRCCNRWCIKLRWPSGKCTAKKQDREKCWKSRAIVSKRKWWSKQEPSFFGLAHDFTPEILTDFFWPSSLFSTPRVKQQHTHPPRKHFSALAAGYQNLLTSGKARTSTFSLLSDLLKGLFIGLHGKAFNQLSLADDVIPRLLDF